jgi:diaminopimelate decarboxylase
MGELVDGFDIASGGELGMALNAGLDPSRISFAGPGKRDMELQAAIMRGVTLNLESEGEAQRALNIAERIGKTPRLAIRVNPDFGLAGSGMKMGGGAKPFGIDAERVPALARSIVDAGAEWRGFHIFAGSQSLNSDAVIETQAQTIALAARLADEAGVGLPHCNLGGGWAFRTSPATRPLMQTGLARRWANSSTTCPMFLAKRNSAWNWAAIWWARRGLSDPYRRSQDQPW